MWNHGFLPQRVANMKYFCFQIVNIAQESKWQLMVFKVLNMNYIYWVLKYLKPLYEDLEPVMSKPQQN